MAAAAIDGLKFVASQPYAEEGYPHDEWAQLRRRSPVHRCEPEGWPPFWAITRHADICEISKQPDKFRSAGRFVLFPELGGGQNAALVLKRVET